jgi:hypothetical protein
MDYLKDYLLQHSVMTDAEIDAMLVLRTAGPVLTDTQRTALKQSLCLIDPSIRGSIVNDVALQLSAGANSDADFVAALNGILGGLGLSPIPTFITLAPS